MWFMNETAGIQRPPNPSLANVYVFPSGLKAHAQIDGGKNSVFPPVLQRKY